MLSYESSHKRCQMWAIGQGNRVEAHVEAALMPRNGTSEHILVTGNSPSLQLHLHIVHVANAKKQMRLGQHRSHMSRDGHCYTYVAEPIDPALPAAIPTIALVASIPDHFGL